MAAQEYYEELSDGNYPMGATGSTTTPCKRDYEGEIRLYKKLFTKRKYCMRILESLLDNNGGAVSNLSLKCMIGTAYVNTYETKKAIDMLIAEQERSGD